MYPGLARLARASSTSDRNRSAKLNLFKVKCLLSRANKSGISYNYSALTTGKFTVL